MMLLVCWRCSAVLTDGDGAPTAYPQYDAAGNGPYCESCWLEIGAWMIAEEDEGDEPAFR